MYYEWDQYAVQKHPPQELFTELRVTEKTMMTPGPTNCSKRVLDSLKNQVMNHCAPEFSQIMDEVKLGVRYAFQTTNRLTLVLSASGHGGMEACLANLLEPGETIIIAKCGIWGERASTMATRLGARVALLETEHGVGFTLDQLQSALEEHRPSAVFVVHAESSTGVKQPLEGIGELVHKYDALLIVDAVASLGGEPFFMDSWGIDAAYTASQKSLGAPPGLSPISFSQRAENKLFRRKTMIPSFYWDMSQLGIYWKCFGDKSMYHHTASSTLMYGLRVALSELAREGLPASWARHEAAAARFRKGLELRGLRCAVKIPRYQLSTVISVVLPPGVDFKIMSNRAMEKYKVEIVGGLGPTVGKLFRVGIMGINANSAQVDLYLRALDEGMRYALEPKL